MQHQYGHSGIFCFDYDFDESHSAHSCLSIWLSPPLLIPRSPDIHSSRNDRRLLSTTTVTAMWTSGVENAAAAAAAGEPVKHSQEQRGVACEGRSCDGGRDRHEWLVEEPVLERGAVRLGRGWSAQGMRMRSGARALHAMHVSREDVADESEGAEGGGAEGGEEGERAAGGGEDEGNEDSREAHSRSSETFRGSSTSSSDRGSGSGNTDNRDSSSDRGEDESSPVLSAGELWSQQRDATMALRCQQLWVRNTCTALHMPQTHKLMCCLFY